MLRPFVLVAVFAFFAGFSAFVVLSLGTRDTAVQAQWSSDALAIPTGMDSVDPVAPPTDPWTFEKQI